MNFSTQTSLQFEHLTKIFSFLQKHRFSSTWTHVTEASDWKSSRPRTEYHYQPHQHPVWEKKTEISLHLEEESIHISVDMLVETLPSRAGWSLYRGCLATRHGHARGDRAVYRLAVIRHFLKGTIPCFQAFSFHRSDVARYDPVQSDNLLFLKE